MAKKLADGRKKRRVDYTDAIKQLYTKFILPLANVVHSHEDSYRASVNTFFCLNTRVVLGVRAKCHFILPGDWVRGAARNDRAVEPGMCFFIRYDSLEGHRVEVTFKEQEIRLSKAQWNVVKDYLEVVM